MDPDKKNPMKKQHPTKEEFRKIESEIGEYKEFLPTEVTTVLDNMFDLLRPYVTFELPLQEELVSAIRGLMCKQCPELSSYTQKWQLDWMDEVALRTSEGLSFGMTQLFMHVVAGRELTAFEDVESMMRHLVLPKEPDLSSMDDYKDWVLTDEQRLDIAETIKENNEWEITLCKELNRLKSEYVNVVQPIILKYFGPAIDEMGTDLWNHFAINMGLAYNMFIDDCRTLLYHWETKELTVSPGMSFIDYRYVSQG